MRALVGALVVVSASALGSVGCSGTAPGACSGDADCFPGDICDALLGCVPRSEAPGGGGAADDNPPGDDEAGGESGGDPAGSGSECQAWDGQCPQDCPDAPGCDDNTSCELGCGEMPVSALETCQWGCEFGRCVLIPFADRAFEQCDGADGRQLDEDCDGLVDCEDPDCEGSPACG